jgi:hypothetical protein
MKTDQGREFASVIGGAGQNRGLVDTRATLLRKSTTDPAVLSDIAAGEAWFHRIYNSALAWQHGCTLERIRLPETTAIDGGDRLSDVIALGERLPEARTIELPDDFLERLGRVGDSSYYEACSSDQVRPHLATWWNDGSDTDSLQRALEAVFRLIEVDGRPPPPSTARKVTASVVGKAATGLVGCGTHELFTVLVGAALAPYSVWVVAPSIAAAATAAGAIAGAAVGKLAYEAVLKAFPNTPAFTARHAVQRIIEYENAVANERQPSLPM